MSAAHLSIFDRDIQQTAIDPALRFNRDFYTILTRQIIENAVRATMIAAFVAFLFRFIRRFNLHFIFSVPITSTSGKIDLLTFTKDFLCFLPPKIPSAHPRMLSVPPVQHRSHFQPYISRFYPVTSRLPASPPHPAAQNS